MFQTTNQINNAIKSQKTAHELVIFALGSTSSTGHWTNAHIRPTRCCLRSASDHNGTVNAHAKASLRSAGWVASGW